MNGDGNMPDETLALVGEIVAPFGIRGQVKMRLLLDDPALLKRLPFVRLRYRSGREERRKVIAVSLHGGQALLTLEGVDDRDASETLRDVEVYILRSELPPPGEDAYYEWQLVGLKVETDTGKDLGTITKVHFYPANDVYETEVALIPAVEEFVIRVDLGAGRLTVRDVPGLRKDE